MAATFVLASGSPRRRQLLETLDASFDVCAPGIDETVMQGEAPTAYVRRIAELKATAVRATRDDLPVLAADTCVVLDGEILGKPRDPDDAAATLRRLAGRSHWTTTGVAVVGDQSASVVDVRTEVTFVDLDDATIEWYVGTGEPLDKAGSYGIQGRAAAFVKRIVGSHSNVVGLPLTETVQLLGAHGVPIAGASAEPAGAS